MTPVFPTNVGVEQVRFSIDGVLVQVEKLAGYDVGGGGRTTAFPFDTFRLSNGRHRLRADIRLGGGRIVAISAPFSVANAGRPAAPRAQLVVGPAGGPLDGRLLSEPTVIGLRLVDPTLAVHHVSFYVDADLAGYDDVGPYELGRAAAGSGGSGSGGSGSSGSFSVSALGAGQHMVQAIVYLSDGRIVTANASFSVA